MTPDTSAMDPAASHTARVGGQCGPLTRTWLMITGAGAAVPPWVIGLFARLGIAGVFWRSGQTKVSGWEITSSTYFLFQDEYTVPVLPPELAAQIATAAEHIFPVLLILGLFTRLSALGLLGMTAVIQIYVYPGNWPEHTLWATALLLLLLRGAGPVSLDALFGRLWCRRG